MSLFERQRVHETTCASVVVGLESLELTRFLCVRPSHRLTCGIARKAVEPSVHCEGLQPVLRRQELQVESSISCQGCWHRLVEPHGYLHALALGGHHHATVEVVVIVAHFHLDASLLLIYFSVCHLGHQVPLFGRVVKSDSTALHGSHAVVYDFDARVLFVVESAIETIAEHQHIHSLSFEVFQFVQFQVLCLHHCCCDQESREV